MDEKRWYRLGLVLALVGCGEGGQTGEATGGGPLTCDGVAGPGQGCCDAVDDSTSRGEVGEVIVAMPEDMTGDEVWGLTSREFVSAHASTNSPMYWAALATSDTDPTTLELADTTETVLSVGLAYDESRMTHLCGYDSEKDNRWIPVHATLETGDGYHAQLSAWLWHYKDEPADSFRVEPVQDPSNDPDVMFTGDCFPRTFSFGAQGFGRFCSEDRGMALWPTPCGGYAQAAPAEAPVEGLASPATHLARFEQLTFHHDQAPPLSVAVTIGDPTACYAYGANYGIAVDVSIETGGVSFGGEGLFSHTSSDGAFEQTVVPRVCGNVSASAEWASLQGATSSTGELCVDLTLQVDGQRFGALAEANFIGSEVGWAYLGE